MATVGVVEVGINVNARAARAELDRASKDLDRTGRAAQDAADKINGLQKALIGIGTVVGAAGVGLIKYGRQAFMAAADVSEMNVAMNSVNKSLGLVPNAIKNAALAVRDNGIEMKSAQEIALIFAQGNLDLAEAANVARVAQDLAVLSQRNSTETARVLAYAIQTGNSMLLKNAGITKYAGEAYQEFAKELGKTEAALTASERQQAVMNMILEEGRKVAGTYEAAMMEAGKVLRSFPRLFNELQVAFGSILSAGFGPAIKAAYDVTKAFTALWQEGGALRPVIDEMQEAFSKFLQPLTDFLNGLKDSIKQFNKTEKSIGDLSEAFKDVAPVIMAAATALSTFAGTRLLAHLPIIGKYVNIVGAATPAALAVFIAANEDARAAFLNLVEAVQPAAMAVLGVMKMMADIAIPVANSLASVARAISENEAALKTAIVVMTVYIAKTKLMATTTGAALATNIAKSVTNLKYMSDSVRSANATFGKSTGTIAVWGTTTKLALTQAAVAMKSFLLSAAPLIALTAAIYAAAKAYEIFTAESKARKQTTEAFTKALIENTEALLENNDAMVGTADVAQILTDSLLSDEDVAEKLTASFGALGTQFKATQFMAMQTTEGFREQVSAMLAAKGVSQEYANKILETVEANDSNSESVAYALLFLKDLESSQGNLTKETEAFIDSLEDEIAAVAELRDQTENLDFSQQQYEETVAGLIGSSSGVRQSHIDMAKASLDAAGAAEELGDEAYRVQIILDAIKLAADDANRSVIDLAMAMQVAARWSDWADPTPYQGSVNEIVQINQEFADQMAQGGWIIAQSMDVSGMGVDDFRRRIELLDNAIGIAEATAQDFAVVLLGIDAASIDAKRSLYNLDKATSDFVYSVSKLEADSTDLRDITYQLYDQFMEVTAQMQKLGYSMADTQAAQAALVNSFLASAEAAGLQTDEIMKLIEELGILDSLAPNIAITIGMNLDQVRAQIKELVRAFGTAFSGGAGMLGMAEELAALQRLEAALSRVDSFTPYRGGGGGGGGKDDPWGWVPQFLDEVGEFANYLGGAGFAESLFFGTAEDIVNALAYTLDEAAKKWMIDGALADPFRPVFEKFAQDMTSLAQTTAKRDQLMQQLISGKEAAQWSRSLFGIDYDPARGFRGSARLAVRQAKQFKMHLSALKDKGFPPSVIAQVLGAGLVGGTAMARELLGMSQADKQELLTAQAEIESISKQVSGKGGLVESLFGVPKLESEIASLDTSIASLITTIQTDLNSAFRNFLTGFEDGIERLSSSGVPAFPANPTSINVNLTAETGADTQRIGREIVDILNQYFRNGGAPLISSAVSSS